MGACWCTWFHTFHAEKEHTAEGNRALKERLVNEGRAHAALVFDGATAVGWCQYGSPDELPNIKYRKEYEAGRDELPTYRLTCFFVDRNHRRAGVAAVALQGALDLMAQAGGGVVETYPQDTQGRRRRRRTCTTPRAACSSGQASATSAQWAKTTASCARLSHRVINMKIEPQPDTGERCTRRPARPC